MNENITILGLDDFDSGEKRKIMSYAEKYSVKIFRDIKGVMIINSKKYRKEGKRVKYSFHAKIDCPKTLINVRESGWDLNKALNKLFDKIENNVQHKFKTEGRRKFKNDKL